MMVQPAAPTSCFSCITTPIVNSSPYQLISGLAQKIADFVIGIFTTIVNFVKYCLCISSSTTVPAPTHPAPGVSAAPATATTSTPRTTIPAINPAAVAAGKQILLDRVAVINQANPNNQFCNQSHIEENGRRAFATVLIHDSITLSNAAMRPLTNLLNLVEACDIASGSDVMQRIVDIEEAYTSLDAPQQQEFVERFTSARSSLQHSPEQAIADVLRPANALRDLLTQNPIFCAAADAARTELLAQPAPL